MFAVVSGVGVVACVACVACVADIVAAVSSVTAVTTMRQPTDRHGTKSNGASRQRDQVEIHGLKSMRRLPSAHPLRHVENGICERNVHFPVRVILGGEN